MTADREALSGEIARVLGEHVLREVDPACSCGWDWDYREVILPSAVDFDSTRYRLPHTVRPEQHRAHLADALADLLAARERGVRAEAVMQAEGDIRDYRAVYSRVVDLVEEWEMAAERPMPKKAKGESAQDQGVRIGVWHSVRTAARELRAAIDGDA